MRKILPEKVKGKLTLIISIFIIIILVVALLYILPTLSKTIPPKRSEWAYEAVQINELRDFGFDGEGTTVGLIDTGIDLTHPEVKHINLIDYCTNIDSFKNFI